MKRYLTTSEAYLATVEETLDNPDFICQPRGQASQELINYIFTVKNPSDDPIVTRSTARNAIIAKYLNAEKQLYLAGEMQAITWAEKASSFWLKVANPDGTINSNYGQLVFQNRSLPNGHTPWEWARDSLLADKDTRQAYLRFSLPQHQWRGNKDQVCTMHMMFLLRENRLYGTTVMRSNDVIRGIVYDMPWFCYLLLKMADVVGVPVGSYTHIVHSLHLYTRDLSVARSMLGRE